ncbi:MAG: hypothetical protein WD407_10730 [Rhodospirillales bacterium]
MLGQGWGVGSANVSANAENGVRDLRADEFRRRAVRDVGIFVPEDRPDQKRPPTPVPETLLPDAGRLDDHVRHFRRLLLQRKQAVRRRSQRGVHVVRHFDDADALGRVDGQRAGPPVDVRQDQENRHGLPTGRGQGKNEKAAAKGKKKAKGKGKPGEEEKYKDYETLSDQDEKFEDDPDLYRLGKDKDKEEYFKDYM